MSSFKHQNELFMVPDKYNNNFAGYHRFRDREGNEWGSFEVFWLDAEAESDSVGYFNVVEEGWYWAAGSPGCLHDGDRDGPYATSQQAYVNAQGDAA